MSQLKALMKQKQAQARLTHPYAKYSGTRLSCSLCGPSTAGLKEVQWGSHLVSKGHRVAVRNAEAAGEAERAGKRSRQDDDADDADAGAGKRARDDDDEPSAAGALPSDFFADPSKAPPPRAAEPEVGPESPEPEPEPVEDDEWAAFEATLSNAPPPTIAPIASATIFAAPVMYEFGAPKVAEEGEDEAAAAAEDDEQVGETEDEKRERLEREEREEIMERIHEEEREQLEADEKVNVLKKRLEMLRGARKKKAAVE